MDIKEKAQGGWYYMLFNFEWNVSEVRIKKRWFSSALLLFHELDYEKWWVFGEISNKIRAEEITDIADEAPQTYRDVNGEIRIDPAFVAKQKNRMDARKWEASKLKPKKYGEKLNLEATGKDGGPLMHSVTPDLSKLTDAQLTALESIATATRSKGD
jgi:hypothetical protein